MMAEKTLFFIFFIIVSIEQIVGPPAVIKNKHENEKDHAIETNEVEDKMKDIEFAVEYKRYLDEVVKTLETDEEFKKKVEASNPDEINSGKIALELEMVNHNVRTKLDELKRQEVQRLKDLVKRKEELGHGPLHPSEYEHIDHFNLDTFEVKDLDNLIKKVSKDMDKLNEMRKEEFKKYEMEKHFEEEVKMANMTDTEKEKFKENLEERKKKHADHGKIHHPGSKAQLEEVWEKQDHLENQDFDPKIFFHLHDIDSNGYWDHDEVKALFIKELEKMYQPGLPEDDMREKAEEMERMREHVFKEMDKNHDNLISFQEYMDETKTKEFNQDDSWDTLDKQEFYSQKEYEEFERQRVAEIRKMVEQGVIPPEQYAAYLNSHPGNVGYHPNQMPQYHPNQVPQYHPNQMDHQPVYHPNQVPQHPGQVPQHPGQVPQHPGQVPQHPGQVPQHPGQYNQAPQHPSQQQYQPQPGYQQNQYPNQIPQQHYQQPNAPYQPAGAGQPNQQQYQVNQQANQNSQQNQQYHPNNQQYQQNPNSQQPNQNNQPQYQSNQNNQQQYHPNQNNQQPNQNNQQPNQNSQQQYQSNQQTNQYQHSQPAQPVHQPNQPSVSHH